MPTPVDVLAIQTLLPLFGVLVDSKIYSTLPAVFSTNVGGTFLTGVMGVSTLQGDIYTA